MPGEWFAAHQIGGAPDFDEIVSVDPQGAPPVSGAIPVPFRELDPQKPLSKQEGAEKFHIRSLYLEFGDLEG